MFNVLMNRHSQQPEWQKIPWHDPDFSRRMLAEHLSQMHDLASRRFDTIDEHVQWIHHKCLNAQPARILDLGCGPGFYTSRLTALGHTCTGMDFSPASIAYAQESDPVSRYILGDVVKLPYEGEPDLMMMIYGELNAFLPADARQIIQKAHTALQTGGKLLLEVSTHAALYRAGHNPASWHTAEKGLFADEPYLCLTESRYDLDRVIDWMYVYLMNSGEMRQYITIHQAYTDDEYRDLLAMFRRIQFFPSLTGSAEVGDFLIIVAEK
ncbi:MAG: class I SAM-dependent methyltransferase [Anaerolineaceae bacterium]|nr:class I SAM-dependent methyltransferase [Anaerolineaceae bacterium]